MKKISIVGAVLLSALLMSGCETVTGITGTLTGVGTDNTPKPTPLVKFKQTLPVKTAWVRDVSSSIGSDYLKLDPVGVDNRIFTADKKGGVLVTNAKNAKKIWWTNTHIPIAAGPTVGEGIVVVASKDGKVVALNENNGAVLWKVDAPNAVFAAPQIGQGHVIIKSIDGKVAALAAATGQTLWIYDHGAPNMVMRRGSQPQIFQNEVITGYSDGKLSALNLEDGRLIWEQTISEPQGASEVEQMADVAADPIVSGGVVYAASYQGKLAAVNARTGAMLWQQDVSPYAGMALNSSMIYTSDADGVVWAFDRASGSEMWHQPALTNRILNAPVLIDKALVVGDGGGYLHFLSPVDGHMLARQRIGSGVGIVTTPAALGNVLYVLDVHGNLSALQVG